MNSKIKSVSKVIMFFILALLLQSYAVSALGFTEIMFNPSGSDTGREWIEIWTEGVCVNLTQYKLFEENTNHNIYGYNSDITCGYAVICNDINKFLAEHNTSENDSIDIILYRSSFSLSNTGEEIALKEGTAFLVYMNYSLILPYVQVNEGYSLEYAEDAWRQSDISGGTPGIPEKNYSFTNYTDDNVDTNNETANWTIEENINITSNDTVNDTINVTYYDDNHTGDHTNNITDEEQTPYINITGNPSDNLSYEDIHTYPCNVSINIIIKNESYNDIYENAVQIKFYNRLTFDNKPADINYSIEYWIEDLEGSILKSRTVTDNQGEKTYTPKIEESDKILIIKSMIKDADPCQMMVNSSEKLILIRNPGYKAVKETACTQPKSAATCSKCTECKPCTYDFSDIAEKNCSQKPVIEIRVCNLTSESKPSDENNITNQSTAGRQTYEAYAGSDNNSTLKSSKTSLSGQTTGMIIYESPNIKNRFYAVIGFMLVGLTVLGKIGHILLQKFRAQAKR